MSLKVFILAFAVVKGCLAFGPSHSKSMILYLRNEIKKNELNSLGLSVVAVGKKSRHRNPEFEGARGAFLNAWHGFISTTNIQQLRFQWFTLCVGSGAGL